MPHRPSDTVRLSKQEWMRLELPYGLWTCADGREVLFNRWYQPIAQRAPSEDVTPIAYDTRVPWVAQAWFYKDGNPPWASKATFALCLGVLAEWGLPAPDPKTERRKPSVERHTLFRRPQMPAQAATVVLPSARPIP